MKEYQEKYIENLKLIMELNHVSSQLPENTADFLQERREKSAEIRRIAAGNTAMLRQHLFPLLDNIVSASEEEVRELQEFSAALSPGAQQLDNVLNYSIHNALTVYARKWGKRDMLIRELYGTGMALFYMQELLNQTGKRRYQWKMGLVFGEAASYIKQYDEIESPETRGFIHRSMANLALSYSGLTLEEGQRKLSVIRRSLQILEDPVFHAKTPSLPWDLFLYKSHQERSTALGVLRTGVADSTILREVMESAEYIRERQLENSRKTGLPPSTRWRVTYESAQFHCGVLTLSEFLHLLESIYVERDPKEYSENGIYSNIFLPALYADYLQHNAEYRRKKKAVLSHMYRQVMVYVRNMPNNQMSDPLLRNLLSCLTSFIEYPDGIQKKDFLLQFVVYRNPDAYVSFRMTAQISEFLMEKALQEQPETLVGTLGCKGTEEVRARAEELRHFAYESGLLHDVGMLVFNNMLRHYGRSWLQEESEMYQYHVYSGEAMLKECRSTQPYAATALGHHRFFNNSGGYPDDYHREENPNQEVTDMVSAAVFLVRLLDDMSYIDRESMTLPQALTRLREESGTRLSPRIVDMLCGMEQKLADYLKDGKLRAYEEALSMLKGKQ